MMAATMVKSCSVFRAMSRLPTLAEMRCFHRTVTVMKPVLQSSKVSSDKQPNVANVPVCRNLHSTNTLLKKFKEELYERFRVYNPEGQYLCTTELYIVEKFCYKFHRYTHEQMTDAPTSDRNSGLKAIQLIDKKQTESENTEKKIKTIRFKKDESGDPKMPKILEILVNTGNVNLHFERIGTKAEPDVKQRVSKFADLTVNMVEKGSYVLATLNTIDKKLLLDLFELIENEHAKHIASVREMLEVVKQEE